MQDIELSAAGTAMSKGSSVRVLVMDAQGPGVQNEFDSQIKPVREAWYPGRKIGILDDP